MTYTYLYFWTQVINYLSKHGDRRQAAWKPRSRRQNSGTNSVREPKIYECVGEEYIAFFFHICFAVRQSFTPNSSSSWKGPGFQGVLQFDWGKIWKFTLFIFVWNPRKWNCKTYVSKKFCVFIVFPQFHTVGKWSVGILHRVHAN